MPPKPGYLEGLRALRDRERALLIFDEVMFRISSRAWWSAATLRHSPRLTCLGKIIGGGLPVGAYGGAPTS